MIEKIPPTIEDESAIAVIQEKVKEYGFVINDNKLLYRDELDKVVGDISTLTHEND